jgi:hypothetical protein
MKTFFPLSDAQCPARAINVEQAGTFEISLYRWAPSMNKAMTRRMNGNEVKSIYH